MVEARARGEVVETSYEGRKTSSNGAEVVLRPERRRRWTPEQKLAIVQESLANGGGPTQVARRYGISTALLYTWRKQLLSAATEGFVACEVVDASVPPAAAITPGPPAIEIDWPGGARLRVGAGADPATLRLVLDALAQR